MATDRFLDDWDFERVYTLDDPRSSHPEWSAEKREAVVDYVATPGMTHEMVALAQGYPSVFGTRQQLATLRKWEWYPGDYQSWGTFEGDALQGLNGDVPQP